MTNTQVTGCILAGGRGLRMGGADKGLISWQGKPLAQHMLERLAPQVGKTIIVANRNLDRYQAFGVRVVSDQQSGYLGPIAGLATALALCETPYLVSVPCDTPNFPTDLVSTLLAGLESDEADVAVTFDGEQRQFLFALYRQELADSAESALAAGERAVWRWHEKLKLTEVPFPNTQSAFANFNSQNDVG
ncbi:molybdenum cofactor guanylyltransferase [Ahniella affigens]|uniref:Molybdenum cofactor guanylyltransferase n=1 Tax=Ahniella affigens TaxID=2021234 RepID=A0A2P1PRA9_9GAMM|nr:molybdenum cofactor guanylyltransferase MobA [Ahniella affigens]AVP97386.1 molybdenum cofactor guanylyltransferase [Ahniella affigens]